MTSVKYTRVFDFELRVLKRLLSVFQIDTSGLITTQKCSDMR